MNVKEFKAAVRNFSDTREIVANLDRLTLGSSLDGEGRYWTGEAAASMEGMIKLLRKAAREGVK